ncbi:transcriptional regulator [Rivularia sp. PCC 7116]|uniref:TetR/AcrR family transcriptional regulator n=1 Tax=Rivularia sp. PCC 7116 TaxID=373994 RepID=UPI00029F01A0|nr:TetR/AcrR family transcriptional regulator [Rivularia sp. PCC 7116]AFY58378.1 transcriptional regulator [Rivularia sp. PCC 7116]
MAENSSNTAARKRRKPRQARSLERVNRILDVSEKMFVEKGYAATTTKAIASQAKVPIGSLYQFFPDKAAILQALAERYGDLFREQFQSFDTLEMTQFPLVDYVDRITDGVEQFFSEHPGFRAVFMEVQATIPEVDDAFDTELIQTLAKLLPKRNPSLNVEDYDAIAFVMVKAIGNLIWLSLGQSPDFRARLVKETKRLTLNYLQSYFSVESSEVGDSLK